MNGFELETMTKVRVLDVRTLAAEDRKPDEKPGAQLLLQAILPLDLLTMFDSNLPGLFFREAAGTAQGALDGMKGAELTSIGEHVKRLPWAYEQTGCTVEIDHGMGGNRNLVLADCKVHRVSFQPQQGGGAKTQWSVDAPGLSDDTRGKLSGLKATETQIRIELPEPAQQDIDQAKPAPARKPGAAERAAVGAAPAEAWPFPKTDAVTGKPVSTDPPPQSVVIERSQPGTRTARGMEKTRAALAAGAPEA